MSHSLSSQQRLPSLKICVVFAMASLDKQSVRAEFDKIKISFDEQIKAGKVSADVAALINTLFVLFNIVLSIFLEKRFLL